jgi:hypothetical protein
MENAVNAVADAQFIFLWFEMNVRGAILVSLPDDLVDELDDAGFLVALGDFLVGGQFEVQWNFLVHLIERRGADAVIALERLLDFRLGRKGEIHGSVRVEAHRVEHRGVEGVAHRHLHGAIFHRGGQNGILKRDLGGDFASRLVLDGELGQVQERPVQPVGEALEEDIIGHAQFAGKKGEERLLRAIRHRHLPRFAHLVVLVGQQAQDGQEHHFYRVECHGTSIRLCDS